MSTALVSFYDFDSYRSKSSTGLQNPKNGFASQVDNRKTSLASVYNSVQNNNNNNITNNNNINNNLNNNNNNVNVITSRRVVTTTASVPINLSHSSHRLQSSTTTVPVMHPKSPIGVSNSNTQALVRGLSTGSQTCSVSNNNNNNTINGNNNNKEHKKLDRSYSEPAEKTQQLVRLNSTTTVAGPMSSRYKTELCRSFAEVGTCKYGDKCQFAHGGHELRVITRHPKFKTENCKSFHSTGFCPYGPRCHFIHNSEESKKSMLNNLSGAGSGGSANGNGGVSNGAQNRSGEQMMNNSNMNMNGNNSMTSTGFGQTYHSNNSSHPLRPKALSIGSYSLGSSGEISPPSSQSGSPTSLNSFFTEDPFNPFASPSSQALGSCANAFSFSPDFASLVSTHNKNTGFSSFGGSQPTLCPAFPLTTNMSADMNENQPVVVSAIFANQYTTSSANTPLDHHMSEGTQGMATTPPPQPSKVTPVSYPVAPESPVDSIASDVEAMKLEQSSLSPIPTCSSPLDVSKGLPRLPIFTRFANNGKNNNDLE